MGTPLDVLRAEIQQDRIALQQQIAEGFQQLDEKLEKHYGDIASLGSRVSVIEDRQGTFGRGLWGLFIALFGALLSWAFSVFKHGS